MTLTMRLYEKHAVLDNELMRIRPEAQLEMSYAANEFNSVCRQVAGQDIFELLQTSRHKWLPTASELESVLFSIQQVRGHMIGAPGLMVHTQTPTYFDNIYNDVGPDEAVTLVESEMKKHRDENYATKAGRFYLNDTIEVVATVRGVNNAGNPAIHTVYKADLNRHIETTRAVEQFIRTAINLEAPVIHFER